jgi:DNA-binding transcriptional ArsR family regulator
MAGAEDPPSTRLINDAASLKALSDPLRLKVLHLLMAHSQRSWTVKEIAAELGQPATKLYHHVKLLEKADLIGDVETRMVSGIVEHRYQTAQRSLQFDDELFGLPETRSDSLAHTAAMLDEARDGLLSYISRDDADMDSVMMGTALVRLTAAQIAELHAKLEQWFDELQEPHNPPGTPATQRVQVVMYMHPTPEKS